MIKKMPATLSTPCDIIGQKAAFFEFFRLASELAMSKKSSKIKGFRDRKKYFCEYLTHSDDLGRVVVPKEIRRTLRIREGDPLEIFTDREGEIILKKYSLIGELSAFAGQYAEALAQNTGHTVCITDRDQVIAVAGGGKKELYGKTISRQLDEAINGRMSLTASREDSQFVKIIDGDMEGVESESISPILCEGDAIGSVVLLNKEARTRMGEVEQKLTATAAEFLGKQMES